MAQCGDYCSCGGILELDIESVRGTRDNARKISGRQGRVRV
jgi:hypothetical protein